MSFLSRLGIHAYNVVQLPMAKRCISRDFGDRLCWFCLLAKLSIWRGGFLWEMVGRIGGRHELPLIGKCSFGGVADFGPENDARNLDFSFMPRVWGTVWTALTGNGRSSDIVP